MGIPRRQWDDFKTMSINKTEINKTAMGTSVNSTPPSKSIVNNSFNNIIIVSNHIDFLLLVASPALGLFIRFAGMPPCQRFLI